jgi:ribonuclease P protein component
MRRDNRLRRTADIELVYREGRVIPHSLLLGRVRPNGLDHFRLAVVAGKRVGNAVTRNRVKRRLREISRQLPIRPGFDVILGARSDAATASFAELARAVAQVLRRANVAGGEAADRRMATFPQ